MINAEEAADTIIVTGSVGGDAGEGDTVTLTVGENTYSGQVDAESQMDTFKRDLQQYLGQIRAMPKQVAPDHSICNAVGGPCHDFRISASQPWDEEQGDFFGPFVDEDEFNKTLQTPALPSVAHTSGHEIVFTHGDLNLRNVMVQNGRISGIIDWENAGWFPDYWEYTKIHYVTKLHKRWLKAMDEVFCEFGDFKSEMDTESQLWARCRIAESRMNRRGPKYVLLIHLFVPTG